MSENAVILKYGGSLVVDEVFLQIIGSRSGGLLVVDEVAHW